MCRDWCRRRWWRRNNWRAAYGTPVIPDVVLELAPDESPAPDQPSGIATACTAPVEQITGAETGDPEKQRWGCVAFSPSEVWITTTTLLVKGRQAQWRAHGGARVVVV